MKVSHSLRVAPVRENCKSYQGKVGHLSLGLNLGARERSSGTLASMGPCANSTGGTRRALHDAQHVMYHLV